MQKLVDYFVIVGYEHQSKGNSTSGADVLDESDFYYQSSGLRNTSGGNGRQMISQGMLKHIIDIDWESFRD